MSPLFLSLFQAKVVALVFIGKPFAELFVEMNGPVYTVIDPVGASSVTDGSGEIQVYRLSSPFFE